VAAASHAGVDRSHRRTRPRGLLAVPHGCVDERRSRFPSRVDSRRATFSTAKAPASSRRRRVVEVGFIHTSIEVQAVADALSSSQRLEPDLEQNDDEKRLSRAEDMERKKGVREYEDGVEKTRHLNDKQLIGATNQRNT
jgi:hypothetical protein